MKIEHVLFPCVFSNLRIRASEGNFQCVNTIQFSEPTKIGSLKKDRVNWPSRDRHDFCMLSALKEADIHVNLICFNLIVEF